MFRYALVLLAFTAFIPLGVSEDASCINDNFDFQKASEETSTYPVVYNGCVDTDAPEMKEIVFQTQYDDSAESSSGNSFDLTSEQCTGSGINISCSGTSVEFEYTGFQSRGDDDMHFKIRVTDGKIPEDSNTDVDVSFDILALQETTNSGFSGGITQEDLEKVCSGDSSGRLDPSNYNCISDDSYAHGMTTTVLDDGQRSGDSSDDGSDGSDSSGDDSGNSQGGNESETPAEPDTPFIQVSPEYPRSNEDASLRVGVSNGTADITYDIIVESPDGSSSILAQGVSATRKNVSFSDYVEEDSKTYTVRLEYNYGAMNDIMGMIPGRYGEDVLLIHSKDFKIYEQIPVWQNYCIDNADYDVSGADLALSDKTQCISNEILPRCFSDSGSCSGDAILAAYSVCDDVMGMTYSVSDNTCTQSSSSSR